MKATMFDGLSQQVGTVANRRGFLRLLGGAMAVGVAATAAGAPVEAGRKGKKQGGKKKVCKQWIVSGGPNATDLIGVDDDLQMTLNGVTILNDGNQMAGNLPPVPFKAKVGDSLAVTARDVYASCRSLSPLWLHCATNGKKRQLSAGQLDGCAPGRTPGVFFSQVFRIKL
jgi:hypothetical protein